jgi:predicted AAA+ superfamily ATPase
MVQRVEYLNRLAKWREKPQVKLLSGIRGCGKTTLFAIYIDWLKRSGADDKRIINVNMEDPESGALLHYQGLYSFIKKRLCVDKYTYVFIDEIYKCENYEKAIEGLLLKKQVDLYAAASNACFFVNAPFVEIKMLPLSFAEYQVFSRIRAKDSQILGRAEELKGFLASPPQKQTGTEKMERRLPRQRAQMEKLFRKEAFNNYLSFGGFPFAVAMCDDAALIRQCAEGIYNTVLVKDVARQSGINDITLLERIAQLMSLSTGRPLSSKKLSAAIDSTGRKISANTVEAYMCALTAAFVFYHAGRFDIKAGKQLKTLGKYYIADTGFRNLLLETSAPDLDGQLENIVCLELLRRGFDVRVGKYGGEEVNFVAFDYGGTVQKTPKVAYFQVMASVRNKTALAGKLSPLERIRDNHSKHILTLDENQFRANHNGIILQNLIDWLVNRCY